MWFITFFLANAKKCHIIINYPPYLYMDNNLEDDYESNFIILHRKQLEFIIGKKFKNQRHWIIFRDNFLFKFLVVPNHTLPMYYEWSLNEYKDLKTRN